MHTSPLVIPGVVDKFPSDIGVALLAAMKRNMQLARRRTTLASSRHIHVSLAPHPSGTEAPALVILHNGARQRPVVPRREAPVHPLEDLSRAVVPAVADVRRPAAHVAGAVAGGVKVRRERVPRALCRDKGCLGRVAKVGELVAQLVHGVEADGRVCCANLHVDLAVLQVADGVDLVPAPGFHVGDGGRDGWHVVVHAAQILPKPFKIRTLMLYPAEDRSGKGRIGKPYVLIASAVIGTGCEDTKTGLEDTGVSNAQLRRHEASGRETRDGHGGGINVVGGQWCCHGAANESGGCTEG